MKLLIAITAVAIFIPADGRDFSNDTTNQVTFAEGEFSGDGKTGQLVHFLNLEKQDHHVEENPIESRRRGRTLCRRRLGGRCVRRRKRCPGRFNSQTSPGKPYCSKFHRCCYQGASCSEAEGFFNSGNQCFKFFPDLGMSWEAAKAKCEDEGLELAKPEDPLGLREYMVDTYGTVDVGDSKFPWIGAQGTGSSDGEGSVEWIRDGTTISPSNSAWYNGHPGVKTSNSYCLTLLSWQGYLTYSPLQPYFMSDCSWDSNYYPLCELVM